MKKVKVVYSGPKNRIYVDLPVGVKSVRSVYGKVQFIRGQPTEMDAEEAKNLIASCKKVECDHYAIVSGSESHSEEKSYAETPAERPVVRKRVRASQTVEAADFNIDI